MKVKPKSRRSSVSVDRVELERLHVNCEEKFALIVGELFSLNP